MHCNCSTLLSGASLILCLQGCGGEGTGNQNGTDDDGTTGDGPAPEVAWPNLECDPLVPGYCAFPFPSNVYTVPDEDSATGRRIAMTSTTLPTSYYEEPIDPNRWNQRDGFSPGLAMLLELPGATMDGLPTWEQLPSSVEEESPTVIVNADSGERVPHFVTLDMSHQQDDKRALLLRPAVRLQDATRYIVAVRDVRDASGEAIDPSPGFLALRDGQASDEPSVEQRRGLYADIFQRLEQAGIERETLQLAWDFTTASRKNTTEWMVHMRDRALESVDAMGPPYTIEEEQPDWNEYIAHRIVGRFTVPLFLDQPGPGASLVLGSNGLPEQNGTAEFEFEVLIPYSAVDEPKPLLQYGHGLLGGKEEIEAEYLTTFANDYGYVLFACDLIGFAAEDELHIGGVLSSGRLHEIHQMVDRQQQGMINYLLLMRMMAGRFAEDSTYGSMIDGDIRYYYGNSQGGIMGGTYMSLTTDVERGILGVAGQPYNLLLLRSLGFDQFFTIVRASYPDPRDALLALAAVQMLWDRSEPTGYTAYLRNDPLPGTPGHEVLINAAIGDHLVTPLGGHIMARTIGAKHLDTGLREVYGLETVQQHEGSSYAEYGFGLPPAPLCNVPQQQCDDPHGKPRRLTSGRQQMDHFLRTGVAENFCEGACSHPEMSGCSGDETRDEMVCEVGRVVE